jgi:hypothetical protein
MKLFFLAIALLLSTNAFADNSGGCGLGWKVNSRISLLGTSTRGTTNSTAGGYFGTTSGTSGCERYSIVKNDKRAIHYTESNYEALILESASGNGEVLDGFALTLGCQPNALGTAMKSNFSKLMDQSSPTNFLNEVKSLVENQPGLRAKCQPGNAI